MFLEKYFWAHVWDAFYAGMMPCDLLSWETEVLCRVCPLATKVGTGRQTDVLNHFQLHEV